MQIVQSVKYLEFEERNNLMQQNADGEEVIQIGISWINDNITIS